MDEKQQEAYAAAYSKWKEENGIKIDSPEVKATVSSQAERYKQLSEEDKLKALGFAYRMTIGMNQLEKDHPLFREKVKK